MIFFGFNRLLKSRSYKLSEGDSTRNSIPGELPLGYIVWFFYSVVLSAKIAILYGPGYNIAANMTKNEMIGSSSLKSAVAISSIVFFLFVVTHHDAQPKSDRESYINNIVYHVTIDILDTTQFLNVLFTQETRAILSFELDRAIIAFACINLILPTLLLVGLSRTKFGRTTCSRRYEFVHKIAYYILVNVPMLVIRSILSHIHDQPVSVFLIKNVIGCGIIVKEVTDHVLVTPAATPSANVQSDMAMISSNKKDEIEAIPLEVKSHSKS